MKSPMVENADYIPNKAGYSELKVLRSGAGYYVGTTYWNTDNPDTEYHFEEPGSRDSDYFATSEAADAFLRRLQHNDGTALASLRANP